MKSTKRILSAILSVVMILGCLSVGFTAQASASDLVDLIANAAAGDTVSWNGGNVTLDDTLVINKNVTVDFNGAVITGPAGKVAVQVKGDVKLFDVVVIADQGSFSGEMAFVKALMSYKPAIQIKGGNVELNCVTAVGSLLRVPNSGTVELPIGNGIATDAGNVLLDNVIAIGMNALDNDNVSSNVTVKDAILMGIYKAVNRSSRVDFGGDKYAQYKSIDVLEGFLNDGVTLSANEKKYIDSATNSEGDLSFASVLINVAKPEFVEPATTFVGGKLNVIADVEAHEEAGVSNRYSYAYTPDYAVIGDEKVYFDNKDGSAQYVATFDATEGEKYDVTVNYDLSIKLGKKQEEIVRTAFDILAHYIDKAPELLNRFVEDFDALYVKAENLVAFAFNVIKSGYVDGLDELLSLIYALEGAEFDGIESVDGKESIKNDALVGSYYSGVQSIYNYVAGLDNPEWGAHITETMMDQYGTTDLKGAIYAYTAKMNATYMPDNYIFDTDGNGEPDSVFAYTYGDTFDLGETYQDTPEFAAGVPGYGAGKGLLDVFDEYYKDIKALIYNVEDGVIVNDKEFNDLGAAAEYVGKNWEGLLELVENAVVVINKAYAIVNGENNSEAVSALLEQVVGTGDYSSVFKAFDKVYKYANLIMGKVDEVKETTFFKTFIADGKAAEYCKRYTLKVWDIANYPAKYFNIPVENSYVIVDLLDEDLNYEFEATATAKPVNVKVTVSGMGSAQLNNLDAASSYNEWFAYGKDITVAPVETYEGATFKYMVVKSNGNQTVVDGGKFTAKAATNLEIVLVFESTVQETAKTEVVFMTDKALNYKYIDMISLNSDSIADEWSDYANDDDIRAPKFEGLTFNGWTVKKDGSAADTDITNLADDVAAENSDFVIVYASYTYKEQVEVETQTEVIKMTNYEVIDGKGYFEVNIQLKGAKAIEAGIILTMTESYATEDAMKINLSGTPGVIFARTAKVTDGYVNQNVQYTAGVNASGTVYARGYVVYEDGTAEYTEIVSLDI